MSASSLAQTKICVEKLLPQHVDELNRLKDKSNSADHFHKLRAAFFTNKLWAKDSTIRYSFIGTGNQIPRTSMDTIKNTRTSDGTTLEPDPLQEKVNDMPVTDAIRKIVKERMQPIVGVKLVYVDDPSSANIRIGFDPDGGAWSLVGTDCLHEKQKPTMNFGWFDVATVMHEFGHALGMIHEHQNPNGNPIDWNDAKVYAWASTTQGWDHQTTETNILSRYSIDQINGSQFDPLSIMLYFFPGSLTNNDVGTHQNLRLSGVDVEWLNKMYPENTLSTASFYESVYSQNISDSVALSMSQNSSSKHMSRKEWITIGSVILVVVLLIACVWWFKNKYKSGGRYGR